MSWIPLLDQLDALNSIGSTLYSFIVGFFTNIISIILGAVMVGLYPIILELNLIYGDVQYVYIQMATLLNLILTFPNNISVMMKIMLPEHWPTLWTTIFMMMVTITCIAYFLRVIKFVKGWIPLLFGG